MDPKIRNLISLLASARPVADAVAVRLHLDDIWLDTWQRNSGDQVHRCLPLLALRS